MIFRKVNTFLLLVVLSLRIAASPMYPHPVRHVQPDGSTLMIVGHGDEFQSYTTTSDGYTLLRSDNGTMCYACMGADGLLENSLVAAHNADDRSASEHAFLSGISKNLRPSMTVFQNEMRQAQEQMRAHPLFSDGAQTRALSNAIDRSRFRGLVILVNYNDRKFRLGEATNSVYNGLMNSEMFRGFDDPELGWQQYTGSVREYFATSTFGQFAPEFDVVGPITVDRSQTYVEKHTNLSTLTKDVLAEAGKTVDFSRYDADGDGVVDMFYMIFAGYGANFSGNNPDYLHACATSFNGNYVYQNMRFGRYACSSEIYGWERAGTSEKADLTIDGIGTIIHEFSHVLGYSDHYDVTYSGYDEPGDWDVMCSGGYNNIGRTPPTFTAYERYAGGFATPVDINPQTDGMLALQPLETSNQIYRIKTSNERRYFLLENRQQSGWDEHLPGHGMLVWYVDSTNTNTWKNNRVNCSTSPCLQIVRAWRGRQSYAPDNVSGSNDPFPGTDGVRVLASNTLPANLLMASTPAPAVSLSSIDENPEGVVTFYVGSDTIPSIQSYETFSPSYVSGSTTYQGDVYEWYLYSASIYNSAASLNYDGKNQCYLRSPKLPRPVRNISFTAVNPMGYDGYVTIYYNTDGGTSYLPVERALVKRSSTVNFSTAVDIPVGGRFLIFFEGARANTSVRVDNIVLDHGYELTNSAFSVSEDGVSTTYVPLTMGGVKLCSSSAANHFSVPSDVTGPDGMLYRVTDIGASAFAGNSTLRSVSLPNSLLSIGKDAFRGCGNLEWIGIGDSAYVLSNGAFADCPHLSTVVCTSATPPSAYYGPFDVDAIVGCALQVPSASVSLYDKAPVWKLFGNRTSIPLSSSVDDNVVSVTTSPWQIYTVDGRLVGAPRHGVNVVRRTDGTVSKVYVK